MSAHEADEDRSVPLTVDFDGTICLADTLAWMRARCADAGGDLERGRVNARSQDKQSEKIYLWEAVGVDVAALPYDDGVLDLVRARRDGTPEVVLVTGSAQGLADAVARHLGLFDLALGSSPEVNLTGPRKAEALRRRFGAGGFDYVGDSPADVPVWEVARRGLFVRRPASPRFEVPGDVDVVDSALAMRPPAGHQETLAADDSWS